MAITGYFLPSAPGADARASARHRLSLPAEGTQNDGSGIKVLIHNISGTGVLLESSVDLLVGDRIEIDLPHADGSSASVVWISDRLFGCRFDTPVSQAALSAAQLRSAVTHDEDPGPAPVDQAFGNRLHRLRVRAGLNQGEVAELMGVSAPAVSGWEKGRTRPKHGRMSALAAILGVQTSELAGDDVPEDLQGLVDRSRREIASAMGTSEDKIRIIVEL